MDGERLAAALHTRLQPLLPEGFYLEVLGSELEIGHHDRSISHPLVFDLSWSIGPGERPAWIEGACYALLDQLQDFVVEATTGPWPSRTSMPTPRVEVDEHEIRLSFVHERGEPSIVLAPIPLL